MESDSILRVCAYHRSDFDLVVVRSPPHEMQPVRESLTTPFKTSVSTPQSGLGILNRLPPEILLMLLRNLDLLSYFRFRQINRRARALSTGLSEYQLVAMHAMEAFRGLLRSQLAQRFTLVHLYSQLITPYCSICGEFGTSLFLPTASRCCFCCVKSSPDTQMISIHKLGSLTSIPTSQLRKLLRPITLRTVDGLYSMVEEFVTPPSFLVAQMQATAVLRSHDLLSTDSASALETRDEKRDQRFMAVTAFPYYDLKSREVDTGVSCKGCHIRLRTLFNFNQRKQQFKDRDSVFSRSSFSSHFSQCDQAQALWAQSKDGAICVGEPGFIRQGGYIDKENLFGVPR
ncbi:hypothetical protein AK830_g10542 [Neonectria ditissima]|uniref:F-box domain-containing protein n=1 Tax=Neonectria ditissima TaxID=78410 RepID=A0A0P7B6Z8_9HYPO|nr:hypothetical protein AK830_g10542 [Neonectria ditissima]